MTIYSEILTRHTPAQGPAVTTRHLAKAEDGVFLMDKARR